MAPRLGTLILTVALAVAACSSSQGGATKSEPPSLVGIWKASDGSGKKVFRDGGSCSGFFYLNGEVLDIGGPMQCQLSPAPGKQGRYALDVTQSVNEATYMVEFNGSDEAAVYGEDGKLIYRIDRA